MRLCLLLVIAPTVFAATSAEAGRGGLLPPLEVEYGGVVVRGDAMHPAATATQLLVGASWASLSPKSTPVDVTLGVIALLPRGDDVTPRADGGVGGYVDVALLVDHRSHVRTWVGGRGELIGTDRRGVLGGALRASIEVWTPVASSGSGGMIVGSLALAVWGELGARERSDGGIASTLAAGLGLRLPLLAAI